MTLIMKENNMANEYMGMPVPQVYLDIEDTFAAGIDRVIFFGPPGTGKTYTGLTGGDVSNGAYRLICTEDMTTADVVGMFVPNEGGFMWQDGLATKAWKSGGRLVIDEIDKASGDVFALLLAYTDSIGSASVDLPTGETIRPAAGFSAVMTSNIENPDELPAALRDRFPVAFNVAAAHPAALVELNPALRMIAASVVAAKPGRRASLRAFYAFEKLQKTMGADRAANIVFGKALAESILTALKIGTLSAEATLDTLEV
jgi:MoxR-like ATPase